MSRWPPLSFWSVQWGCKLCCKALGSQRMSWAASKKSSPSRPVGCLRCDRLSPRGTQRRNNWHCPKTWRPTEFALFSAFGHTEQSERMELRRKEMKWVFNDYLSRTELNFFHFFRCSQLVKSFSPYSKNKITSLGYTDFYNIFTTRLAVRHCMH